jgi:protocatechuate 3,4-dioxygenase beta subunit
MTRRSLARTGHAVVLLGLALSFGPAYARQQPPRDAEARTPAVGTGVIAGKVIGATTGQAVRRATVRLSGSELRGGRSAMTDDQGRFTFTALPAGRFTLSGSKPGHVTISYGQKHPGSGRPGTPIQLADGQQLEVSLALPKGGVITGTLLDEHGEPPPGVNVRALRYAMRNGERVLQQAENAQTDDRGIYRIYGLPPGEYIVTATPRNTNLSQALQRVRAEVDLMRRQAESLTQAGDAAAAQRMMERVTAIQSQVPQDDQPVGYAPVYFPGTTNTTGASVVTLGMSEERAGIDFQLQLVRIARVEGLVLFPEGPAPRGIEVRLTPVQELPGVGDIEARTDAEGRFRLSNVAPGQYKLVASGTIRGGRGGSAEAGRGGERGRGGSDRVAVWAAADVFVDGRDITNIALALQPGMTVSGRLVFEGTTAQPPADLTRVRLSLDPVGRNDGLSNDASARADANGRFTLTDVMPGKYRLTAGGASGGWVAGSVEVGGVDTLDFPLEVRPNENVTGAVVRFTDRQTELTGTLQDRRGQPTADYTIIVFPADRRYWVGQARRIQSGRPGTDGRFTFSNLPPGDYRITAVPDPEPGIWYDPAFLEELESVSIRVSLADGEMKTQDLRIAGQ